MRLSELTNVDEAWYDPRTWFKGKPAAQPAAAAPAAQPAASGNMKNAADVLRTGQASNQSAAPKTTKQGSKTNTVAAPAAPAAPAVDADLEQRKETARLFGPDKSVPAAQTTAAMPSNQVAAAKPAAPAADPTKDPYSAAADPSLQAGYKELAAAPPPPDVEAMKKGIAAGSSAAQAAVSAPEAPAPVAGQRPGGIAFNQDAPAAKTSPPTQQATMENITMKQLLQIFEAPTRTAPADTGPSSGLAGDKTLNPDGKLAKNLPPNYYDPVRNSKNWKDEANFKMPSDPMTGKPGYDRDSPAGYGRYGKNTADLQKYINSLGYKDEKGNPLQIDARMGPKTGAAIDALRAKLDPNSAEYKTLRSFDAAASMGDKDSRISGPMKKMGVCTRM